MPITPQWELRAEFARRLSHMYGKEVPAYTTLLEVSQAVNDAVLSRPGSDAERLGSIARVTAERHGAIRVGTPQEMAQVARVFAAMGMHPVGFYDLREAAASSVPVVSTPSGPRTPEELARNPFRCSRPCSCPRTAASSAQICSGASRVSSPGARCSPPNCWSSPTGRASTGG